jgi:hypothetical protein
VSTKKAKKTTTIDIVIRLEIKGRPPKKQLERALDSLADVMAVQAEDGLWALGSPDAEDTDDIQNELVAHIKTARVHAVLIEGVDDLMKDHP